MSLEDSSEKGVDMCCKEYDIMYKQLPVLLEKMEILFPTEKKMENSELENKSETKKVVARPAASREAGGNRGSEGYKDLEESIKEFIKELDEAENETDEGTGQPATPPSSVEDEC